MKEWIKLIRYGFLCLVTVSVASSVGFSQNQPGRPGNQDGEEGEQNEQGGIPREFLESIPILGVNETPFNVPNLAEDGVLFRFRTPFEGIYRIKTFTHPETPVDTVINLIKPIDPETRPEFIAFNDDVQEGDVTSELNRNLPAESEYVILAEAFDASSTGLPFWIQVQGPLNFSVFPNGRLLREYEFSEETLEDAGWAFIPGGFGGGRSGRHSITDFREDLFPRSNDNRGITVNVDQNDVAFLYAQEPIFSNGNPIVLRVRFRANNDGAALFLAALRGHLRNNDGLDGSVSINQANNISDAVEESRVLELIYRQPPGTRITPLIQVVGSVPRNGTNVFIDNMIIFELDSNGIF